VQGKLAGVEELKEIVAKAKAARKKVVFTNGCFDLLHVGHLHLLREAKKLGHLLIVALNSDSSIGGIKGPERPVLPQAERAELIGALEMVDYVTIFNEAEPVNLIRALNPDVLVKGGDWAENQVVGRELVEQRGGKVVVVPFRRGHSTTNIIERVRKL
jgi:rfaE bifunctional protein nucleotidyltransferase chain/domain